jgi:hypothetical protein
MNKKAGALRLSGRLGIVLFVVTGVGQADVIDITLNSALLAGDPGSALIFGGTLTNADGSTVFLNGAGLNLAGFSPANEDTSPFFVNAPLFLDGGVSTPPN